MSDNRILDAATAAAIEALFHQAKSDPRGPHVRLVEDRLDQDGIPHPLRRGDLVFVDGDVKLRAIVGAALEAARKRWDLDRHADAPQQAALGDHSAEWTMSGPVAWRVDLDGITAAVHATGTCGALSVTRSENGAAGGDWHGEAWCFLVAIRVGDERQWIELTGSKMRAMRDALTAMLGDAEARPPLDAPGRDVLHLHHRASG